MAPQTGSAVSRVGAGGKRHRAPLTDLQCQRPFICRRCLLQNREQDRQTGFESTFFEPLAWKGGCEQSGKTKPPAKANKAQTIVRTIWVIQ